MLHVLLDAKWHVSSSHFGYSFLKTLIYCVWVSFQLQSIYWEGGEQSLLWDKNIFPEKRMYKHTHTHTKMWDFYESYPVIFHFFPATSFLEQNPRKPKKTICAVSKNFAKLNYVIHLADLMSSWMQFANLHFGHKEIMHLLYMKKHSACYRTIFCNCSGMPLYVCVCVCVYTHLDLTYI